MSKTGISSHTAQQAKAKQNFAWLLMVETIHSRVSQATDKSIALEVMDSGCKPEVHQEHELRMCLGRCPTMQISTRCHETQDYRIHQDPWTSFGASHPLYLSKSYSIWTCKKQPINWKLKKKPVTWKQALENWICYKWVFSSFVWDQETEV